MLMISDELRASMLSAADAAASVRVEARAGYLRGLLNREDVPYRLEKIRPGVMLVKLRCDPPPCVGLWVVADDAIPSDWVVV